MERVRRHEMELARYADEALREVDGLRVLGPPVQRRSGVTSFTLGEIHPHDLSQFLDAQGIAVRAGHHCAQPLMRAMALPATTRASFYVYNDRADVDALATALAAARQRFGAFA